MIARSVSNITDTPECGGDPGFAAGQPKTAVRKELPVLKIAASGIKNIYMKVIRS